jgi:succinoglycan biosynthesis transport protein ExoP
MEQFAPIGADGRGLQDSADLGRYRQALRRGWLLILGIVVPLTALVLAVSILLPPTYRATATISLREEGVSRAGGNPELVRRELETVERLVTTKTVLAAAARGLRGESVDTLAEKVNASASPEANLVRVSAEDRSAAGAAQIANVVSETFLTARVASERRALTASRRALQARIERLAGASGRQDERAALRAGLRELVGAEAGLGAELALADAARPPDRPDSPRVLQNTLFALFGFSFIAILIALARDQLAPRVRDARELANLIGAPLLVEMPAPKRESITQRRRAEQDAYYDVLSEAVRPKLTGEDTQIVLVAGLLREPAAAEVARGLADALVREGEKVAVVGGRLATGALPPPVSEVLRKDDVSSRETSALLQRAEQRPGLFVFSLDEDAALGARSQLAALADGVGQHGVRFVVLVGRPLLVSRGALLLPRLSDGLLLVCRPERTTRDDAHRLRELLLAGDANVLGIASIGARQFVPHVVRQPEPALEHSV